MWVDTHCHLQLATGDPAQLMARAEAAGVGWIVVPGVDAATSEQARDLATADPRVKWAAGLHPHDASRWPEQAGRIAELIEDADAVGEIGLDFYRNNSPRNQQVEAFRAQLELARTADLPVLIHCRDAFAEVHEILSEQQPGLRVVMHCWTAGPRWTKRFSELGVYFSYAGPLIYPTGDTIRLGAREAPRDRTVVETDTPLLSPPPHRDEENEPARVPLVGRGLAEVWGVEPVEVERLTTGAAERVFNG